MFQFNKLITIWLPLISVSSICSIQLYQALHTKYPSGSPHVLDNGPVQLNPTSVLETPSVPEKHTPRSEVTLVTAFYEIDGKHSVAEYNSWMSNLLTLQESFVIHTSTESLGLIERHRYSAPGLKSRTLVLIKNLYACFVCGLFPSSTWEAHKSMDPERHIHRTHQLYWIWLNKVAWVKEAVDLAPFHSRYYIWIDIGCIREKISMSSLVVSLKSLQDTSGTVAMQAYRAYSQYELNAPEAPYFEAASGEDRRVAGAIMAGSSDAWGRFHEAFYGTLLTYQKNNKFMGNDQNVLARTCLLHRELCSFVRPVVAGGDPWFSFIRILQNVTDAVVIELPVSRNSPVSNPRVQCLNNMIARSDVSVWTMLVVDSDENYLLGALKLAASVRRHLHGQSFDLNIMQLSGKKQLSPGDRKKVKDAGWNLCTVDRIAPRDEANTFPRFRDQFTKLHLWNMTQYKLALYMDSDSLCVGNISYLLSDELLDNMQASKTFLAAGRDIRHNYWEDAFNMGVFVARPNAEEYLRLVDLQINDKVVFETGMSEQGFLNKVYTFGSWTVLPFIYNANLHVYKELRAQWNDESSNMRIIHFTDSKPWSCGPEFSPVCVIWHNAPF